MKKEELENLSDADEKVRRMLASLKQVEAPKDFEFRLKARIASARPKAYQTSYKRRLAFALPAFASIAVSAFVVLNMNSSGNPERISSITPATALSNFAQPQNSPGEFIVAANTTVNKSPEDIPDADSNAQIRKDEKSELSFTAVKLPEKPRNEIPKPASKVNRDGAGSKVRALTVIEAIGPKGINLNPNANVDTPPDFNREKSFSVQELLSPLGVEVVAAENGKWKVKNVSRNSPAERSGIKADDIIETLDGKKLSGSSVRGKKIEVKKLGVKRAGAQVEINLQTNPK